MKNVYVIFPNVENQEEAIPPMTRFALQQELNEDLEFIKKFPKHKDKGMVRVIVNCNGEMVHCEMEKLTKRTALDEEIVKVFKEMKIWEPGKIKDKKVDTSITYSFKIKDGSLIFE